MNSKACSQCANGSRVITQWSHGHDLLTVWAPWGCWGGDALCPPYPSSLKSFCCPHPGTAWQSLKKPNFFDWYSSGGAFVDEGGIGKFLNTIKTWNTEKQQQAEQAIIIKSLTAQFLCSLGWKHCSPPEPQLESPSTPRTFNQISQKPRETAGLRCISSKHSAAASPAFRHILGRKPCVLCGICPAAPAGLKRFTAVVRSCSGEQGRLNT